MLFAGLLAEYVLSQLCTDGALPLAPAIVLLPTYRLVHRGRVGAKLPARRERKRPAGRQELLGHAVEHLLDWLPLG